MSEVDSSAETISIESEAALLAQKLEENEKRIKTVTDIFCAELGDMLREEDREAIEASVRWSSRWKEFYDDLAVHNDETAMGPIGLIRKSQGMALDVSIGVELEGPEGVPTARAISVAERAFCLFSGDEAYYPMILLGV